MRLKIALLCAALVGFGNARAGLVGIQPTSSVSGGNKGSTTQNFSFKTSSLTGSKITGIGLYGRPQQNKSATGLKVSLVSTDNIDILNNITQTGSFDVIAGSIGAEQGITWNVGSTGELLASKTYTVTVTSFSTLALVDFNYINTLTTPYTISTVFQPSWNTATTTDTTDLAIILYGTVPEPATMILTGSALAAGAIGAYFKRRRKPQTEIAA